MKSLTRKYIESLEPRKEPYFFPLQRGISIGVRRYDERFSWVIRISSPKGYTHHSLPQSLTFEQVKQKALNMSKGKDSFSEAKEDYLRSAKGRVKDYHNLQGRLHLDWYRVLDDKPIQDITSQDLSNWVNGLKSKVKPGTVNKLITHLKAVMNHSYRLGKIDSDQAWRGLQKLRETRIEREILSAEEEMRLLEVMDPSFKYLFLFALDTGARYGELRTLTWDRVYPENQQILLTETKNGRSRVVPYRIELPPRRGSFVFTQESGEKFNHGTQSKLLTLYCTKAHIRHIRFHDLRHTWTTRELMRGVPIQIVSKLLGHSSTEFTEKRYSHLLSAWYISQYRMKSEQSS